MNNQRRFIVLSHGRTGSTYLVEQLNRTADIRMYSEVFHDAYNERPETNGNRFEAGQDSWTFVEDNVYCRQEDHIKTVGFKLFYFHARDAWPENRIWTELPSHKDIDVVVLGRKNYFAGFISEARAKSTSIWHPTVHNRDYEKLVEVTVDLVRARRFMTRTSKYHDMGLEIAQGHRIFEMNYEDLLLDAGHEMKKLIGFLGGSEDGFAASGFLAGSADKNRTKIVNIEEVRKLLAEFDADWMAEPYV
jgi:LPS sulfotransferase NodH